MYKMWGLDDNISCMFGMPPIVDDGKDLFSSGAKVLRVGGDRLGYAGWITPCFLEAMTGSLKLGVKLLPKNEMFKEGSPAELLVGTLNRTKAALEKAQMPVFSITEALVNQVADMMKMVLSTKEKIKLLTEKGAITKVNIVGGGISGLLSALFLTSLYELEEVTLHEKEEAIGGRLSKNYSGGMRFVQDKCIYQIIDLLNLEVGTEECFLMENVNETTLLYNPDAQEHQNMFQKFIGSATHKEWVVMLDKLECGIKSFKEVNGITQDIEMDWEKINKTFIDLVKKLPELRSLTLAKFMTDYCNFTEEDIVIFKAYGFGGGAGKMFSEFLFINMFHTSQDDRYTSKHVYIPHLAHLLAKHLENNAEVVVKLEQTWNEQDYSKEFDTVTIDARNVQLQFPNPGTWQPFKLPLNWQPLSAPKVCLELETSELSAICQHVLATNKHPFVSNVYFIGNIALSYVWLSHSELLEEHVIGTGNEEDFVCLKKEMKNGLNIVMKDLLKWNAYVRGRGIHQKGQRTH